MKKLPLKKLIEFRRLSDKRRLTFVNNLKKPRDFNGAGGDYWIRGLSAISTAFKMNDKSIIIHRLDKLYEDFRSEQRNQTRVMYKRNIDILEGYKDFDFEDLRPTAKLTFLQKPKDKSIININGLPIQVLPNHVFSYDADNNKNIGAIWFVTWLDGYKLGDLGIFAETLFHYLSLHYSEDYIVNPSACMVIDVSKIRVVGYDKILSGEVPSLIDKTVSSMKKYI